MSKPTTAAVTEPIAATTEAAAAIPDPPYVVTVVVPVKIKALALLEADGRYSVAVPGLPGCVTMGDDIEDVQKNVVEAVEGWLAVAFDDERDEAIRSMLP
jgi:predicted RNase H-like HicB family nuclease